MSTANRPPQGLRKLRLHRHHRLIALVLLLALVLPALPLLGGHAHASGAVGADTPASHCDHHGHEPSPPPGCDCLHACAGATLLRSTPFAAPAFASAATPVFAPGPAALPDPLQSPPYRPPTATPA